MIDARRRAAPRGLRLLTFLLVAALLAAAWVPLLLIPLHHDIGWPLHVATRVLSGERLYGTIIEINPPLIFWFALLAQVLGSAFGIGGAHAYHVQSTMVVVSGVCLTAWLLRALLGPSSPYLRSALLVVFAFLAGPFAGYQFGQREHLLFATLVPYLLGAAATAEGRRLSRTPMFVSGLLTAFGLAMKPFFVPIWIGTEAWLWKRRGRASMGRPQGVGVLAGFVAYGAAALLFARDYVRVARWGMAAYGDFFPTPLEQIVFSTQSLVVVAALLVLALVPHLKQLEPLRALGALSLVTLTLAVYAQHKGWDYHWYPVLAMAWFLASIAFAGMLRARVAAPALAAGTGPGTSGADGRAAPRPASPRLAHALGMIGLVALGAIHSDRALARWGDLRGDPYFLADMRAAVAPYAPTGEILPLSTTIQVTVPLVNYTGLEHASRFAAFWPLPAAYRDVVASRSGVRYHRREEMGEMEAYVFDSVIDDLARGPELVVVDRHPPAPNLYGFDWLAYFGQSGRFNALFSRYREVAEVGGRYRIFVLAKEHTALAR